MDQREHADPKSGEPGEVDEKLEKEGGANMIPQDMEQSMPSFNLITMSRILNWMQALGERNPVQFLGV